MKPTSTSATALALRPRWLIVDDEPALSEIIADTLAALDLASVENFTAPAAALAAFSARAGAFDLVVTDRDMPGCDGLEFARRLHAQAPGVKVVLVSAHTDDLSTAELRRAGIGAVVRKPFNLARLETAVRALACAPDDAPLAHAA